MRDKQSEAGRVTAVTFRIIWRRVFLATWRMQPGGRPKAKRRDGGHCATLSPFPKVTQYRFATLNPSKIEWIAPRCTDERFRNRQTWPITRLSRGPEPHFGTPNSGERSAPDNWESDTPPGGNARHPIVEDDVVIYAGATILGRVR
jgi:hypothetical protein